MGKYEKIQSMFFSSAGATKIISDKILEMFDGSKEVRNLLLTPLNEELLIPKETLLIVSMPVYAGRIPQVCVEMLLKLKGNNTPVIGIVVYGNRDYDDALLELKDTLESRGFVFAGLAAFVAEHSLFTAVAAKRPDLKDGEEIEKFCKQCNTILNSFSDNHKLTAQVKGNRPYKKRTAIPFKPTGNNKCNKCGSCIEICPVNAIPKTNPRKTDKKKCISCIACIHICPQKARNFNGFIIKKLYSFVGKQFTKKYSVRREPETFF